ncbi:MAG: hypothetical protein IH987_19205, partial [Planctomycetes bacterium]|nr:hypothetical protein [Planctomycetota bacterium]
GPDVVVGQLRGERAYGGEGGVSAFSFGYTVCNLGDEPVEYVANTNEHPIITHNLYRLSNGRFEQIGMSWVTHEFLALALNQCDAGCLDPGTGALLGVGCSVSNSSGVAGVQSIFAPRSPINAHTGDFPYPWSAPSPAATIGRRLQVHNSDLDPALNGGAVYFVEGQIIAPDDSTAGNQNNNASYRPVEITFTEAESRYEAMLIESTRVGQAAIRAWRAQDPSVVETEIQVPGEGFLILAAKATDLKDGMWRYEYALQNVNSDRSVRSFAIPLPHDARVDNIGFHDVDYHSGDPFDPADWTALLTEVSISWSTNYYQVDLDANALRWGTLYNFRFDARACPGSTAVSLELFKPGVPTSITVTTTGPETGNVGDFTEDCVLDLRDLNAFTTCLAGPGVEFPAPCMAADFNNDARIDLEDVAALQVTFAGP